MFQQYRTAPVRGLEEFEFYRNEVLTFNDGVIRNNWWKHVPSGIYSKGDSTKSQCVQSARRYRDALREEQAASIS